MKYILKLNINSLKGKSRYNPHSRELAFSGSWYAGYIEGSPREFIFKWA